MKKKYRQKKGDEYISMWKKVIFEILGGKK